MIPDPQAARFRSVSNSAALAIAAAAMLVPANLLPVINTQTSGRNDTNTIFSGVVELWQSGLQGIAMIVFTASIVIPALKLFGLAWLLFNARPSSREHARHLTRLYATLDFIGRWSMLDVFLVAFLTGLVRFGLFSTVEPRPGIIAFAVAVVLTIFATRAFDPRLLWPDHDADPQPDASPP